MHWSIKNQIIPQSLQELKKVLLENRGVQNESEWFKPPKPTTFKLEELQFNVQTLKTAIKILEKIKKDNGLVVVFGDYDADGISATAILWRVLHNLGFNAKPFIPDRLKHGYGLTVTALNEIYETSEPALLITVDNGIVAHEAVSFLNQKKCQVIITDHHLPEEKLPAADAIFHSTAVCGAGVSWFFGREIVRHFSPDQDQMISKQLDLVGIATIADQMPISSFNRSLATWGIKALKVSTRLGLLELIKKSGLNQNLIDSGVINYALAPRINAMGRLKNGLSALRLLCTNNATQAFELAEELSKTNIERQDLTTLQIEEAMTQVEAQASKKVLIVKSKNFHEGVIGLIAGKITEQLNKPIIVIALGEKTGKASARSIPGINIIELIRQVKDDLIAAGGHPMAAGFSIANEKIDQVTDRLQSLAEHYAEELFVKTLKIECILPASLIEEKTFHTLKTFEPFGVQNPVPIFGFKNLKVVSTKKMGQDERHLRLVLSTAENIFITVIAWKFGYMADKLPAGQTVDIAGDLSINDWRGRTSIQITARSIELN